MKLALFAVGRSSRALVSLPLILAMAGCNSIPRAGPDDGAIRRDATAYYAADKKKPLTDYVLVDLTESVLTYFPATRAKGLKAGFGAKRNGAPELPVGIGDVLQITIFESSAGGLFIPSEAGSRAGNFVALPQQTVDRDGTIAVPYAGQINVVGKTPAQIQAVIVQRLADRAIEPQAVINVVERSSSKVSVLGDVTAAATMSLNPAGERVLDLVSRAGGLSGPANESTITLQREGTTATVAFKDLIDDPRENVFVYPNDTIYVSRERRTFLAFGASGLNGRIDFEESNLSFAEGVGKAGGLLDARADPGEVFLYRLVDPAILAKMGFPVSAKSGAGFPVIFRANMRDPSTFFLTQQFPMQDKDIIYISNADSVEVTKVLDVVNTVTTGVTGPAVDVAAGRTAVRLLKN